MGEAERQTRRLFVAVPLPESLVPFVSEAQRSLEYIAGLRTVGDGALHCTLAFIGEADVGKTEAARSVIKDMPAEYGGECVIGGFVMLPSALKTRVVALGIADLSGVLGRLFEAVNGALEAARVAQREKRPFRPHITIARLRVPRAVQPMSDCGKAAFGVESVCLYESRLCRDGSVYTVLAQRDLQRA